MAAYYPPEKPGPTFPQADGPTFPQPGGGPSFPQAEPRKQRHLVITPDSSTCQLPTRLKCTLSSLNNPRYIPSTRYIPSLKCTPSPKCTPSLRSPTNQTTRIHTAALPGSFYTFPSTPLTCLNQVCRLCRLLLLPLLLLLVNFILYLSIPKRDVLTMANYYLPENSDLREDVIPPVISRQPQAQQAGNRCTAWFVILDQFSFSA